MTSFFRKTALVLAVCALCCVCVFAVEGDNPDDSSVTPVTVDATANERQIVVNVEVRNETPLDALQAVVDGLVISDVPEDTPDAGVVCPEFPAYSTVSTDTAETDEDTPVDTVRAVLESLFGKYTPRTQTVTNHLSDGTSVTYREYVSGVAGMDWDWLAGVTLFALMLFCLFRLLGGVLRRG